MAASHRKAFENAIFSTDLFVQRLLLSLTVLLATLLGGHVVGSGRAGVGVEGRDLGFLAAGLVDGLDRELLLALI